MCIHTHIHVYIHILYIYICIIKSSTDSNNAFDDLAGVVGPAAAEGDLLSAMIGNCNDTRRHDIYIYIERERDVSMCIYIYIYMSI